MWHLGKWAFFDPSHTKVQKLMMKIKIDAYIYSTSTLYILIFAIFIHIYILYNIYIMYIYIFSIFMNIFLCFCVWFSLFGIYVNHTKLQPLPLRCTNPALPISPEFQAWCTRSGIWPLLCPSRRPKIPRLRSRWPSTACATYLWLGCESLGERFGARGDLFPYELGS